MRCPLYIGIAVGTPPASVLPDATRVRPSTAGGWELQKGPHEALAIELGKATVGATTYRVFSLLVTAGDQRRVHRWLDAQPAIVGPYDLETAPAALITFLRAITGTVAPGMPPPVCIAGEDPARLASLRYMVGTDPLGDDDEIAEVT